MRYLLLGLIVLSASDMAKTITYSDNFRVELDHKVSRNRL